MNHSVSCVNYTSYRLCGKNLQHDDHCSCFSNIANRTDKLSDTIASWPVFFTESTDKYRTIRKHHMHWMQQLELFILQYWENDSLRCLVSSLPAAVDSTPFCRLHAVDKTAPVTCKHSAFPEKLRRNFIVYPNSMYWLDGLRTLEFSGTNTGYFFLFATSSDHWQW
jgi:hypothetical protein